MNNTTRLSASPPSSILPGAPRHSDFTDVVLPTDIPPVPGQISNGEQRYIYALVSHLYRGEGAVVELGAWLGLSTVFLAAGLRDSHAPGVKSEKVHTFDAFVWGGGLDNDKSGLDLARGDDFMPKFLEFTKSLAPFIQARKANFLKLDWPADQPVEILFLDGPKTAKLLKGAMRTFATALMPGRSYLVCQDYQHPPSYETPLCFALLKEKVKLSHALTSGGTVSFTLEQPLTPEDVEFDAVLNQQWDKCSIEDVWETILAPLEGPVLERLKCAKALHLCKSGFADEAVAVIKTVEMNPRLAAGWKNWALNPAMRAAYRPLFEEIGETISD